MFFFIYLYEIKPYKMKTCTKCKDEKSLDQFYKHQSNKDRLDKKCKKCKREDEKKYCISFRKNNPEYDKKRYLDNLEERSLKGKEWYSKNKEEHIKRTTLYQNNNREKIRIQDNKYKKNKKVNNPEFKLKSQIIIRIGCAFKREINGVQPRKSNKTNILLGCSVKEYINYLKSLFKPEMNLENYGTIWEIDHIKPCILFDLTKEEEQLKCFHFSNTQPLFKTTEIAKNFGYEDYIGNRNKSSKYNERNKVN